MSERTTPHRTRPHTEVKPPHMYPTFTGSRSSLHVSRIKTAKPCASPVWVSAVHNNAPRGPQLSRRHSRTLARARPTVP